jgi:hypothetical protein
MAQHLSPVTGQSNPFTSCVRGLALRAALVLAVGLAASGSAGCASRGAGAVTATARPHSEWAAVEGLAPRSRVQIERRAGGSVSGTISAVTPGAIEVDTASGAVAVTRVDVARVVRVRSGNRRAAGAARGVLIGGAVGVAQSLLFTQSSRLEFALRYSAVWVPIGATLGAISGADSYEETVVYVAAETLPNIQMQPTRRMTPDGARLIWRR